jgi:multicomponent Na+:H+ antiporter subunit E
MKVPWARILVPVILWLVLTGGAPDGLVFGAFATAAAVLIGLAFGPAGGQAPRPILIAALLPRFLWRSLLGGVDVAVRALRPRMPLKPGWLVLPTRLPPGPSRVAIGGEFSLMPGTLVAGARGDALLVHCLDTDMPVAEDMKAEEERYLAGGGRDPGRPSA